MDRIFLGGVVVSLIVAIVWTFVPDPTVGAIVAHLSTIFFFYLGWRYALRHAPSNPSIRPRDGNK